VDAWTGHPTTPPSLKCIPPSEYVTLSKFWCYVRHIAQYSSVILRRNIHFYNTVYDTVIIKENCIRPSGGIFSYWNLGLNYFPHYFKYLFYCMCSPVLLMTIQGGVLLLILEKILQQSQICKVDYCVSNKQ